MKKELLSIILVSVILLSACTGGTHDPSNQPPSIQNSPQMNPPTYIQSYVELQAHHSQQQSSSQLNKYGTDIVSNGFPIPCQNCEPVTLDSTSVYPITIFDRELYGEPWIWYHCNMGQSIIHIKMMLNQELVSDFDETSSASDIVRSIDPNAPNVNSFDSKNYISVEECTITTADGTKSALIKKAAEYGELYITFLQNDFLVVLMTYEESISDEWLASFSITQSNAMENDHVTE